MLVLFTRQRNKHDVCIFFSSFFSFFSFYFMYTFLCASMYVYKQRNGEGRKEGTKERVLEQLSWHRHYCIFFVFLIAYSFWFGRVATVQLSLWAFQSLRHG
ncbi:putative 5'-3' exonuclease XRNB, putative,exoribonuclease 2 [Trypanosoma cruzi Dm28c]|uniref:Putative 5'-3' exonuclease XRNB, putative,exoribonuclease 2 n=1 Tax=Trypanosoma cruzi Dm28c TaxID=1416333 RepID=V5BER9_TRYCR|nr:putative 5'-3' exonuclease XRNB, putative,exoribonuclease 2 [Trypanosoma cruzi Dm28c]